MPGRGQLTALAGPLRGIGTGTQKFSSIPVCVRLKRAFDRRIAADQRLLLILWTLLHVANYTYPRPLTPSQCEPSVGTDHDLHVVAVICRKAGISQATYFNWRKKYDGLLPDEMRRLKQLEDENAKLKKLVAELSLDRETLQDVIRRKL